MSQRTRIWVRVAAALAIASIGFGTPSFARAGEAAGAANAPVPSVFDPAPLEAAPASVTAEGGAADSLRMPEDFHLKRRFLRTAFDVLAVNYVSWAYCRYIREDGELAEFRISWKSIHENLKAGMEWDDNNFSTNHFAHPYHGSTYYTSARANGYDFWESVPWAFAGSWHWEYMCEANHGSINDWMNTSLGGIALGEALYRLSDMVVDNTARGNGRAWRELAVFGITPMRGFNRLLTGEAFAVHQNPPDRLPDYGGTRLDLGMRVIGNERVWRASSAKTFLRFSANYGDPFREPMERPFDHFNFVFHVNFDNSPHNIGQIAGVGYLGGGLVSSGERTEHILASYQHFDYVDNEAFTYGAQAVGASFLSRFETESGFETRTEFHANAIVIGASKSDYFSISGREYDYGPGVGYKLRAAFGRGGREYLSLGHSGAYIYSNNGNDVEHFLTVSYLKATIPIRDWFVFGADYILYLAEKDYNDYPDVSARNPEARAYISWMFDK